jgi:uncharacterized protein (DUF1330 family)
MKANHKLALVILASMATGVGGAEIVRAQQAKTPPAYVIAEVEVTDPAGMQKYGEKVPETLAPFNNHYVVRGGKPQAVEGDAPKSIVMIAFDSVEKAHEWYDSPGYQAIKAIRQSASKARIYIVEGVAQ